MNIAVFVSGGGTNLQALIDARNAGAIKNGRLALVLSSSPDAFALTRAEQQNIPREVLCRKDFANSAEYDKALLEILSRYDISLIVLAGFLSILSPEIIRCYRGRIINVHPALIPSFCGKGFYGLRVHEAALEYGVKLTGATVHFVDEIPDGGPIILQKAVPVLEGDTPESLQRRVMKEAEWQLLPEAVSLFCEGRLQIEGRTVRILEAKG